MILQCGSTALATRLPNCMDRGLTATAGQTQIPTDSIWTAGEEDKLSRSGYSQAGGRSMSAARRWNPMLARCS